MENGTLVWDSTLNSWVKLGGTGDAAHVHQTGSGPQATAKNRRLNAINTTYARATNGASYASADNVTEVYITVLPSAAGTAGDLSKEAIVTFDAPTEGVASSFLSDTGGQAVNVQQWPLQLGVRMGPYTFSSYLSWVDVSTDVAATAIIEGA